MDDLLRTQSRQHTEVDPNITLYLFEYIAPRAEVSALKQRVEAKYKALNKTGNKCREV